MKAGNYLGGAENDAAIVEKLVVPQLEKRGKFTDLLAQMKSATGRYNVLWYSLLHKAEEAKIALSTGTSAEIDLSFRSVIDEDGKAIDDYIQITRSEFEALVKESIDSTAEMLKRILTRNSLRPQDLKFVLMVGGSTYIPFVRKRVEELLGIPVNTGINPTNAIVVGAAYFAASKEIDLGKPAEPAGKVGVLRVKAAYNRTSQDAEEIFSAKVEGNVEGLCYRITRADGGYDSGLKTLASRISEDLPLQEGAYNLFALKIFDGSGNHVAADVDPIEIAQGKCPPRAGGATRFELVLDDLNTGDTAADCIFAKNCVIPARTKKTVEVNKTVIHGSDDDLIRIIVVEGPSENDHIVNRKHGELIITGKHVRRDVPRGTIDLTFELTESRDLKVTAYVNLSGPEFSEVFNSQNREVDVDLLRQEVELLEDRIDKEMGCRRLQHHEAAQKLDKLSAEIRKVHGASLRVAPDDVTDEKFRLDDRKRQVAQEFFQHTAPKRLENRTRPNTRLRRTRPRASSAKTATTWASPPTARNRRRNTVREFDDSEKARGRDRQPASRPISRFFRRKPDFLIGWFQYLKEKREAFNDQSQAKNLIEAGKRHIEAEDWDELDKVIGRLLRLLPEDEGESNEARAFITNISRTS